VVRELQAANHPATRASNARRNNLIFMVYSLLKT